MSFWVFLYRLAWILLVVLAILAVASFFLPPIRQYRELRQREAELQQEIQFKEEVIRHLKERQARLQSDPTFVEKIAREEFGLARPGETIYKFTEDEPQTGLRRP